MLIGAYRAGCAVREIATSGFALLAMTAVAGYVNLIATINDKLPYRLQLTDGHNPVALRQRHITGIKIPRDFPGPLFSHSVEVQQGNAQAQITIQRVIVAVGTLYKVDSAVLDQETVGLAV